MNGVFSAVLAWGGLSDRAVRARAGARLQKWRTFVRSKAGKENARETRAKSDAKPHVVVARRGVLLLAHGVKNAADRGG